MKMKRIVFLVILLSLFGVSGFAQADLQPAAIVNLIRSEPITVKQLRTEVEKFEKGPGRLLTESDRREVLDNMINDRLVQQAAERDKITVSDNEIERQIQGMRSVLAQNLGRMPTDAEFAQAVRNEYNLDVPAFRIELRKMYTSQKYLMTKKEDVFKTLKEPTEAEIKKFFDDNQTKLFTRPQTVRLSAIQVPFGSDRPKAKEQADRLARDINNDGDKFDEAAMRGKLPNSTYKSGDDIYLPRNDQARMTVGDEFVDVVFSLKRGEISRVLMGKDAYYLARVVTIYTPAVLGLNDIYQLGVPMTVHDYIGNVLAQQKQQEILVRATQELVAELRAGGKTFQVFERNLNWQR
jgi:parvulin-like peptidyl-prolyl isomerase